MRDQNRESGGPLWTGGEMMLRVQGKGREPERIVRIKRPFALIGQAVDADIRLIDQAVSTWHVYLHLDPRGLYAVDLATRTGTRLNGTDQRIGWLRPGQWLEVAGRGIEVLRLRINGTISEPPPCDADLLCDAGQSELVMVTLEPRRKREDPWVLGSEMVFLGWSAACGIPIKEASVARTHCALIRTPTAAYLVDLCGHHTRIEDRPIRGASILHDGAALTIGTAQFTVQVAPPNRQLSILPRDTLAAGPASLVAHVVNREGDQGPDTLPPLDLIPVESQRALLTWIVETIQGNQSEVLQKQEETQVALTELIRQLQQDNATLLNAHLKRIENVDRELATLRAELSRRAPETSPASPTTSPAAPAPPPTPTLPPPPSVTPLRIPRTTPTPASARASTTWLLERINRLENENHSAWKIFLARFTFMPRRAT